MDWQIHYLIHILTRLNRAREPCFRLRSSDRMAAPQMLVLPLSQLRIRRAGGAGLALVLIAGFFLTLMPLASVSAGNLCALACCAGRAPHAAGSCMNETCHAAIKLQKKSRRVAVEPTERLCGSNARPLAFVTRIGSRRVELDNPTSLQSLMARRPCLPDCGGCATSSASTAEGKTIAKSVAQQLHSHTNKQVIRAPGTVRILNTLRRCCSSRGPPTA